MDHTTSKPYLTSLEIARGFAAIMVLLFHASTISAYEFGYGERPFGNLFLTGRAGVDFFFVLSGFIITYIHILGDLIGCPGLGPRASGRSLGAAILLLLLLLLLRLLLLLIIIIMFTMIVLMFVTIITIFNAYAY